MHRIILLTLLLAIILISSMITPGCDTLVTEVNNITTAGNPHADFGITGLDSGCVPCSAQFVDKSNGPRDKWTWFFGDGDSSFDSTPLHIYDSAGVYTVSLRIDHEPTEGTDTEVKKRFMICGESVAGFTISKDTTCRDDSIIFTPIEVGGVSSYQWNFGDNTVSSDSIATHSYSAKGTYTVTLQVSGPCGTLNFADSNSVTILTCPVADFEVGPPDSFNACAPLPYTISLQNTSTFIDPIDDDSVPPRSYLWDLGNGVITNVDHPPVTYDTSGDYAVKMVVTDILGGVDSITKIVSIFDNPKPHFYSPSLTGACQSFYQQFLVKFESDSSRGDTAWIWDFGDGKFDSTYTNSAPVHAYINPGYYNVKLTTLGQCGVDSIQIDSFVVLYDSLEFTMDSTLTDLGFSISTDSICAETDVTFTAYDLGATYYIWDFGDGNTANTTNHIYTYQYTKPGFHNVSLTIGNQCEFNDISIIDTLSIIEIVETYSDTTLLNITAPTATIYKDTVIVFTATNTALAQYFDSLVWRFSDSLTVPRIATDTTLNTTHIFADTGIGIDTATVTIYGVCDNLTKTMIIDVTVPTR